MGELFISMHVFSAAASETEAADIARKLGDRMGEFGELAVSGMKRYWKIPEYYEFSITLCTRQLGKENVREIVEQLGSDWQEVASNCFIWNWSSQKYFVDERLRWIEIDFSNAV